MTKLEIYDYILHYDIRPLADRLENLLSEDRITGGACYYVYNPYEFYSFKQIMELSSKACKSKNYFRCIKRVDTITFGIWLEDFKKDIARTEAFLAEQEAPPLNSPRNKCSFRKENSNEQLYQQQRRTHPLSGG